MRNLTPGQLKAVSEFLNTVAAAWFAAATASPLFSQPGPFGVTIFLTASGVFFAAAMLALSLVFIEISEKR